MPACVECGADVALDENFCGGCGARIKIEEPLGTPVDPDLSKSLGVGGSTLVPVAANSTPVSTGDVAESAEIGATSRAGDSTAPARRSTKPKALSGGKVLNNRYEIVRRIGGGGM